MRETRIDLIRGFALLAIFVGHGSFAFSQGFQQSRGFSDASELFVMMAGMSCGLAYYAVGRPFSFRSIGARTLRRARLLYLIHVALVLALVAATRIPSIATDPEIMTSLGMAGFWNDVPHHLWEIAILEFMPADLDILPLYVVLLALVPLIFLLHDLSIALLVVVSVGVWLVAGLERLNFINFALPDGWWYFDPLSWQLVFTIGAILGIRMKNGVEPLPFHPAAFALAAATVVVAVPANLLFHFYLTDIAATGVYHAFTSKTNAGVVRLLNAVAIVYVVWNLGIVRRIDPQGWLRPIYAAGRHSLPVFVAGLCLSTPIAILMTSDVEVGLWAQVSLMLAGCLIQLFIAMALDRRARMPRTRAPVGTLDPELPDPVEVRRGSTTAW